MDREKILANLGDHPWANHLIVFNEVGSTSTMLKALGSQGAPHGTVMIADRQTGGRGRLGRSFQSPGGAGIYLSALIRPDVTPDRLMHLTCAAGAAMCDGVETQCGIRPQIKWTNDLVIGTRKLGGILTELALDPRTQKVDYAVIGIGINCLQQPGDFDDSIRDMATSLTLATGRDIDREGLAAEMIRRLCEMSDGLLSRKEAIMARYAADCMTVGKDIRVIRGDSVRQGRAIGIDADGGLVVRYQDGQLQTVSSGEVSIRGMYGYLQ